MTCYDSNMKLLSQELKIKMRFYKEHIQQNVSL